MHDKSIIRVVPMTTRTRVSDWNILCRRNLRTTANIPNAPRGEM